MSISNIIERKYYLMLALTAIVTTCMVVIIPYQIAATPLSSYRIHNLFNGSAPGIYVGNQPVGVAIDPLINTVYITNARSNTVSVIDFEDRVITNIAVDNIPFFATYDILTNTIDIANSHSDTVSVIDPLTNRVVDTIKVGSIPIGLADDPITAKLYVTNSHSNTVSVIDRFDVLVGNITVGRFPQQIAVNTHTNIAYVSNLGSNTVSVIDGNTNRVVKNVTVGRSPYGVAVNQKTNMVYVVNGNDNTVSVIDGNTNRVVGNITVGRFPQGIAVNPNTNIVYVTNSRSNTTSVIDGKTDKVLHTIAAGSFPYGVAVNSNTNLVYVTNSRSNTVTVINGTTNTLVLGISFKINPPNLGDIYCNGRNVSDKYLRYDNGTELKCEVIARTQNENPLLQTLFTGRKLFSTWSGLSSNSTDNPITFTVLKYGTTLTANFKQDPPMVSSELLTAILTTILGIVISAIGTWLFTRRRRNYLNRYMKAIDSIYATYQNKEQCLQHLGDIRRQIMELFGKGTISESQYKVLNDKISKYYNGVTK